MSEYSDIIDNRRSFLKDEINSILKATREAKFAVGYLFLSGFNEIIKNISNLNEIKLIIGPISHAQTIEEIAEGVARKDELEELAEKLKFQKSDERKKIISTLKEKIGSNIGGLEQSNENETMLLSLKDLIASGKLKVRLYTKQRLHSKAYIFKYNKEAADQTRSEGIAVVGSSNLTLSGFKHSTELNVIVRGNENFKALDEWFDSLWEESVDFKKELLSSIDESWALKYANPYDIYILTLYHLVESKMKYRSHVLWDWSDMPKLYRFQKVAVMQAYEILNNYDGVFVCDVVGLGKTFIGAALLKQLGKRAVIICPPRLKSMWEEFGENFNLNVKIVSHGALTKGDYDKNSTLWRYKDRDVVLIDESHYFRNSDTRRYYEIFPFLTGKQVILVTATPQNTSIWNIYNQIRLFNQQGSNDYQVAGGSLKEYFDKVERREVKIHDLLSKILIRRTRNHIKKFYQTFEDIPIEFPKRELETISYNIDKTYNNLFDKIEMALKNLTYAKYNLWKYVKEEKKREKLYLDLWKVTGLLKGLHKVMLYKRLESSIFSFSETIRRLKNIHEKFSNAIELGIIPGGDEAQDLIYQEDIDISDILDELKEVSKKYKLDDFNLKEFKKDLKNDIDIFKDISNYLDRVPETSDKKFDEIKKLLKKHAGEKFLIFSEYADTVEYLHRRLKNKIKNFSLVTSKTKNTESIICRFAPKANEYTLKNGEQQIDVVVSTDVFSSGLNLQDCGIVVNYDIHWNPVLLIQRVGRIDRIGSEKDIIRVYNFLPHKKIEEKISLKDRISIRIQEIHDHIGEDEKILDESERLNESALYAIYDKKTIDELEEKMDEDEFNLDEAELLIDTMKRDKPEYWNYIKNLQPGTRSCKKGETSKGIFAYCRKGEVNKLYILNKENEILSDIGKVITELKCKDDEKLINLNKDDKQFLSTGLKKIEETFKNDYSVSIETESKKYPIIVKAIQKLTHFRKDIKEEEDLILIDKISKVLNKGIPDQAVKDLKKFDRLKYEGKEYLKGLVEIYNKYRMGDLKSLEKDEQEYKPIELICSEMLK